MNLLECSRCGSNELVEENSVVICIYCQSRFVPEANDLPVVIDIQSDIISLLRKCIDDPKNRRRYANLILDIDPSNTDALKYLN